MSDQAKTLIEGSKIFCPACNAKLNVSGLTIGSKFFCPGCNGKIEVPPQNLTSIPDPSSENSVAKKVEAAKKGNNNIAAVKALSAGVRLPGQKSTLPPQESEDPQKEDKPENEVLEEFQSGYKVGEQVIRPCKVIVNKLPEEEQPEPEETEEQNEEETEQEYKLVAVAAE